MAAALEDSLRRLREQERLMSARAEESERLNSEIVSSLASGLLVVGLDGEVRTLKQFDVEVSTDVINKEAAKRRPAPR